MLKLLAYLKDIVAVVGVFYLISLYFKSVFQLSLLQVMGWWIRNFSSADNGFPLLVGLFFCLLTTYIVWMVTLQAIYMSVLGETKTYLYVGAGQENAMFVDPNNLTAEPFSSSYSLAANSTFKNIYAKTPFVFEKGTDRRGVVKEGLSARRLVHLVAFGMLFTLILWVVLHMFGSQAYVAKHYENPSHAPPAKELFNQQSEKIGLKPKQLAYIGIGLFLVGLASMFTAPAYVYGKSAISIGSIIYPGAKIAGKTRAVEIIYTNSPTPGSTIRLKRDTGRRYAVFEFREGLPTPVYVSLYFDESDQPDLYNYLLGTLETQEPQAFNVTPELGLSLIE